MQFLRRGECPLLLRRLGETGKVSWSIYFSSSLPPCRTTLVLWKGKAQKKWFSWPSWLRATSVWGLWPQVQFHIPFNGLMGNTLSTVYQQHWSSCSRKRSSVGKRLLASFLHKRAWLNQRDVWLFSMLRLINNDKMVEEVGLELCEAENSFGETRQLLYSPNTSRGARRLGDTWAALWKAWIFD